MAYLQNPKESEIEAMADLFGEDSDIANDLKLKTLGECRDKVEVLFGKA
jgi:hypothetical protein